MRWILLSLLSLLCLGCDDGAVADEPEARDAGASDAAADAGSTDAAVSDADALIMGDSDAGAFNCAPDDPLATTVSFIVRNTGAAPRFVPVQGDLCAPFIVRDADGRVVPQRVSNVCSAECACLAGTPLSWATRYVRLEPGEDHTFIWEAQYTERCERDVYCPEFEGRGRDPRFTVARPVWRNLPAAQSYTVELAYEDALPEGCDDPMTCQGPSSPDWFGRCEAGGVIEAEFIVGAAVQTSVEIDLQ